MLKESIKKIISKEDLSIMEAEEAMNDIMTGTASPSQISAFLVGLRMKGETIEEITGCAKAMKNNAIAFDTELENTIDTCGTGGDGGRTFNISTAVAIVAAAGGVKVIKHGNRAVSSRSGSADVLTELGFNINLDFESSKQCLKKTGMTFLFAQKYHIAMKNAAPIRKELETRTIFNLLGPICNPGNIKFQVMGVFDKNLTHPIAEVLSKLGRERAMLLHGNDGLDEITLTTTTTVSELKNGKVIDYIINPEDYGMKLCNMQELAGGDAKENAEIIKEIFQGTKGCKREIVLLNSAAALYIGKMTDSFEEGLKMAADLIDSGKAIEKLQELIAYSKEQAS